MDTHTIKHTHYNLHVCTCTHTCTASIMVIVIVIHDKASMGHQCTQHGNVATKLLALFMVTGEQEW